MFKRIFAALGLALVASVSASTAMAWAAPYSVVTDDDETSSTPEDHAPEDSTPEDIPPEVETDSLVVELDSAQFTIIVVGMSLLLLFGAAILVTLWGAK